MAYFSLIFHALYFFLTEMSCLRKWVLGDRPTCLQKLIFRCAEFSLKEFHCGIAGGMRTKGTYFETRVRAAERGQREYLPAS